MSTDRNDPAHEARTSSAVEQDEDERRAVVQLVRALTALSFGDPSSADAAGGSEVILARRTARIAAGGILVAAAFALGAIALRAPNVLAAASVTAWLAGALAYAVVRAAAALRLGPAPGRSAASALSEDAARFRAHRLQNASTLAPYAGFVTTVAFPLGWMVESLGAGAFLSAAAIIASALVAYVALRAVLDHEVQTLGIDAVGAGRTR